MSRFPCSDQFSRWVYGRVTRCVPHFRYRPACIHGRVCFCIGQGIPVARNMGTVPPPPPRASRQTFLIRLTDYGILCKQPVLGCRGFIVEDAAHEVGVAHVIHDVQSHLHAQPKPCLGANPLCSVGGMVYHAQVSARHPLRYMCRLRRWFGGGCGCRTGRLQ